MDSGESMARIRYLKPDTAEDTRLAEVSRDARLLYRDLWCHMDRQGITEDDVRLIKKRVFPYDDDLGLEAIEDILGELIRIGRLFRLQWAGKKLLYCPSLTKHQKFHRDEKPKYSIPDDALLASCQPRASTVQALINTSANSTGNWELVTGNGEQELRAGNPNTVQAPSKAQPLNEPELNLCFEEWKLTLRHYRAGRSLLADEQTLIARCVQKWGAKAVRLALKGARHEPKDDRFDPSKFVRLTRYLDIAEGGNSFHRFLNLGVQNTSAEESA